MKIGVLTSSRADYGIYTPLLRAMREDSFFDLEIIAFGSHLSAAHGSTISEIEQQFPNHIQSVTTSVADGTPKEISLAYANTLAAFSEFWDEHHYDLVLCLGDRYEMSAAVQAGIPFGVRFAHFHGGEKTQGAIDEIYRHQISLASEYHFTAADAFSDRVRKVTGRNPERVVTVGSMSLSDINQTELFSRNEFNTLFDIPDKPFILCTIHPETSAYEQNHAFAAELSMALETVATACHLVINPPNADTHAKVLREAIVKFCDEHPSSTTLVESFGKRGYFTAMKESLFLLGNSSSGIIEAASFGKFAINIGNRQEGRLQSGNVINVPFKAEKIIEAAHNLLQNPRTFSGKNQYVKENTIQEIIKLLKSINDGTL